MTKHSPSTRSLRNPLTGECKHVTSHEATRLRGYGWEYIKLSEFKAWQVAMWATRYEKYYDNYKLVGSHCAAPRPMGEGNVPLRAQACNSNR